MSYGCIYKITKKSNGMCYIGKSVQIKTRFSNHKRRFSPKDYNFEILAEYNSEKELKIAEQYWIWRYKAFKEGYNKNRGGGGPLKLKIKRKRKSINVMIDDEDYKKVKKAKGNKTWRDFILDLLEGKENGE